MSPLLATSKQTGPLAICRWLAMVNLPNTKMETIKEEALRVFIEDHLPHHGVP